MASLIRKLDHVHSARSAAMANVLLRPEDLQSAHYLQCDWLAVVRHWRILNRMHHLQSPQLKHRPANR